MAGADTNIRNIIDDTPLHVAVRSASTEMVMMLVEYCNTKALNNKGETALDIAKQVGKYMVIRFLS